MARERRQRRQGRPNPQSPMVNCIAETGHGCVRQRTFVSAGEVMISDQALLWSCNPAAWSSRVWSGAQEIKIDVVRGQICRGEPRWDA